MFCNYCNDEISLFSENCLVFEAPRNTSKSIKTIPKRISKQMEEFDKRIGGSDIIISRQRQTGYTFFCNGRNYNIDVDFMWQNYLSTVDAEDRKIVIGSNHTIYAMYMINLIECCKKNDSNLLFIALPHVKGLEDIEFKNLNLESKKITLIAAASKMKEANSKWDGELYNYIEKIPKDRKEYIFKRLYNKCKIDENEGVEQYINRIIYEELNIQKLIKGSKFIEDNIR